MQLNEVGQVLLPLTGIDKNELFSYGSNTEIGIKFNEEKAPRYCLFVFANRSSNLEEYLNKVSKIVGSEDKGLLRRLYTIECAEDYKKEWSHIMKGRYSLVNKEVINRLILPTLKGNKRAWKQVFDRDDLGLRKVLETRFQSYKGEALKQVIDDTISDMKAVGVSIELKEPIKHEQNSIVYTK